MRTAARALAQKRTAALLKHIRSRIGQVAQADDSGYTAGAMFRNDFTLSKRQLGLLLIAAGAAGFAAILSVDLFDAGRQGGIGPAQRIGLGLMVGLALIGLTLIPLGNAPA